MYLYVLIAYINTLNIRLVFIFSLYKRFLLYIYIKYVVMQINIFCKLFDNFFPNIKIHNIKEIKDTKYLLTILIYTIVSELIHDHEKFFTLLYPILTRSLFLFLHRLFNN